MAGNTEVRSVRRAFRIIEVLVDEPGLGISEIAAATNLPKSTVHNHLATLKNLDIVRQEGREYRLTLRLLEFAGRHRKHKKIYQSARRPMSELAIETDGLVDLYFEEDGHSVLLNLDYGKTPVEIGFAYEGMRRPLHISASGLSMLAFQPDDYVKRVLQLYADSDEVDEPIDEEALWERLETIRSRSYAIDEELALVGMGGVGAPITNRSGRAVAGMSVYKPINDMSDDFFRDELPDLVCNKANFIEVNLNYN